MQYGCVYVWIKCRSTAGSTLSFHTPIRNGVLRLAPLTRSWLQLWRTQRNTLTCTNRALYFGWPIISATFEKPMRCNLLEKEVHELLRNYHHSENVPQATCVAARSPLLERFARLAGVCTLNSHTMQQSLSLHSALGTTDKTIVSAPRNLSIENCLIYV